MVQTTILKPEMSVDDAVAALLRLFIQTLIDKDAGMTASQLGDVLNGLARLKGADGGGSNDLAGLMTLLFAPSEEAEE